MNLKSLIARYPHSPASAAFTYAAVVLAFAAIAVVAVADIVERYRSLGVSAEVLARLQTRATVPSSGTDWPSEGTPPGSPFLEGPTVTVASAALLERLTSAVVRAGGDVVSFEVEPQSAQSKDGYVKAVATCELEQSRLRDLLHDLEAGMPFLFVDQFVAQAPVPPSDHGRLQVRLAVSGLWPGASE
jgi:general secretion pathway protein M